VQVLEEKGDKSSLTSLRNKNNRLSLLEDILQGPLNYNFRGGNIRTLSSIVIQVFNPRSVKFGWDFRLNMGGARYVRRLAMYPSYLVAVAEIAPVLLTHGPQYYIDKWTRALYVAALI